MNKYDIMRISINKNIEELSEFVVDSLGCTNYYDLIDYIINLYNFKIMVYEKDSKLHNRLWKKVQNIKESEM